MGLAGVAGAGSRRSVMPLLPPLAAVVPVVADRGQRGMKGEGAGAIEAGEHLIKGKRSLESHLAYLREGRSNKFDRYIATDLDDR